MKFLNGTLATAITLALAALPAAAQTPAPAQPTNPAPVAPPAPHWPLGVTQTFYLVNATEVNEGNEILTSIRNITNPETHVSYAPFQKAIIIRGAPEQLALAQKVISDLDRPRKTYRLTYTLTEKEDSKRIGVQHHSLVAIAGQRTVMKEGSKVPIVTASYSTGNPAAKNDVTYLDIGLNFDAQLQESANGLLLRTKVEQSSIAEQPSGVGAQDPVIRQTYIEGSSIVTPGKPLTLGSIDIPGSTRHLDVEVIVEAIH